MNAIVESFEKLRASDARLRARDAARHLGITEAELVAAGCTGEVQQLVADFEGILEALPALGEVTVICRNEAAVHEKKGPFTPPAFHPAGALTHGGPIDLRLFFGPWRHAFAQVERGGRRSLQIFDKQGVAVMKVYLSAPERYAAFDELVARFAMPAQPLELEPAKERVVAEGPVDAALLRARWSALQDTHEFFPMLRELKLERTRAFAAVGEEWARSFHTDPTAALLELAAARGLSIMVFAGNHGALNIHTGPVRRIVRMETWLNVLDPDFNLHLDTSLVHSVWRVRKPTVDGIVTSIELFDEAGEAIALFFGERKPGVPELQAWRDLVAELEASHA